MQEKLHIKQTLLNYVLHQQGEADDETYTTNVAYYNHLIRPSTAILFVNRTLRFENSHPDMPCILQSHYPCRRVHIISNPKRNDGIFYYEQDDCLYIFSRILKSKIFLRDGMYHLFKDREPLAFRQGTLKGFQSVCLISSQDKKIDVHGLQRNHRLVLILDIPCHYCILFNTMDP
jgi:hypothetical protein